VHNEQDVRDLHHLPGVRTVKRVQNGVFKVQVEPASRDDAMARFRGRDGGGVCHHAYKPKGGANTRYYLTDRIIARFQERLSHAAARV